jgi:outer membrane lipoprotein-sorting protein
MNKVAFIALVLLIVSSLLGCNTQGKSAAGDILDKSISKMKTLSSFKETDTIVSSTKEETSITTLEAEYDLSAKKSHSVKTENDSVTTSYFYGGYLYTSVSDGKWQKEKVAGAGSFWLAEVSKMTKNPKSVRVISENSTTYELGLDVKRQLVNLMLYADVNANPKAADNPEQVATVKAVENMNGSVVLTVAKDTLYLERADIEISITAMPDIGDLSLKEDIKFYDFNKPVDIALPDAAKSASGE